MSSFIEFKDFTFQYHAQKEPTLKNINLTIDKGQKVLIIGPSGSGKSTLAHCLNGIVPNRFQGEQKGQLLIDGHDVFNQSVYEKSQLVSTVLQDPDAQFIGLTIGEDLAFSLENDCVSLDKMRTKVNDWASQLQLSQLLKKRPQDISGGQKQRVSLAGVLIDESPILLFDEPLANLDPQSGQDTIALIDRIHRQNSVTTLIIEHRLEDVLYRHVDKIILINDGQIVFDGTPDNLLQTSLLQDNGIREPLYISVLKDLNIDLTQVKQLSEIQNLNCPSFHFDKKNIRRANETLPKTEPILEVANLNFAYQKGIPILKDISLTINKGERLAIVGTNGAGKSTFVKALCKFVNAEGEIVYDGQLLQGDSTKERASKIGYVLQNPNQMISQSMIFEEVALGLRYRNFSESDIKQRVEKVLKVCGLYAYRNWPISALSFGQKKRVTIASILVLEPQVIILDEPTAGQDETHYREMMLFLNHLNDLGHTIILVTHDMQLLLEYTDRVVVISDGQVIADTKPYELFNKEDILKKAHLKKTSLYELAQKCHLDPLDITQFYIEQKRSRES